MVLRSALVTLCLLMLSAAALGQGFTYLMINDDPLEDACTGGVVIDDGAPVLIFHDPTFNGPSDDDYQPVVGAANGQVNFNTFSVNGQAQGVGAGRFYTNPGWTSVGSVPQPTFFYVIVCGLDGLHYYSSTFFAQAGIWELHFGRGQAGDPTWTCMETACPAWVCLPPEVPTNLVASTTLCTGVELTWDHPGGDICGFNIYRGTANPLLVGTSDDITPPFSWTHESAPNGNSTYRVRALRCCEGGDTLLSQASGTAVGTRIAGPPPTVLVSVSSGVCDVVNCVIFANTTQGLDLARIYRDDTMIGTLAIPVAGQNYTFVDENPPDTEDHNYRSVGWSEACSEHEMGSVVMVGSANLAPTCTPVVTASTDDCDGILVTWTAADCENTTEFHVYRNTTLVATIPFENDWEFFDTVPAPGIDTGYHVRAANECGEGPAGTPVIGSRRTVPGEVGGVEATDGESCECITITWTDLTEDGIIDYGIYRDGTLIGSAQPGDETFEDCATTLVPEQEYTYCVTATNECGEGNDDGCDTGYISDPNDGSATLALVSAGPPDWDYSLTWTEGCVSVLTIRDLCEGTIGSFTGTGWTAQTFPGDSVVFTANEPLQEGVATGFRLSNSDEDCVGDGRWTAGNEGGLIEGPLPVTPSRAIPDHYALAVYPNPFNPTTNLNFALPTAGLVKLNVYDVTGRLVKEVVNGTYEAGYHNLTFDAGNLPSGLYFARINSRDFVTTKKLMLVK